MPSYITYAAALLAAALPFSSAQTYTDCDPTKQTGCAPDPGLRTSTYSFDFRGAQSPFPGWRTASGTVNAGPDGAEFTVQKRFDAPTIETDFYFFFGKAEVTLKAAPGTGIVSSIVIESDDLDEVDWEALGGDTTQIQTNYFGKGDTTTYDRATFVNIASPQTIFHKYTVDWTSDYIKWYVDDNLVRTLNYADAQGGARFPQTPARLRLGVWAGGDPSNSPGTIQWAGGQTDYSQGPFTMYVQSVNIINYTPADEYQWTDQSGSWQSIKAVNGSSPAPRSTTEDGSSSGSSSSSSSSTQSGTSAGTSTSTSTPTATASGSASSASASAGSGASKSSDSSSASSTAASSSSPTSSPAHEDGAGSLRTSFGPLLALCVFVAAAIVHV